MDYGRALAEDLVQLARLAMTGRRQDIQMFIRRISRKNKNYSPELANELNALLQEMPSVSSPFRSDNQTIIPVDNDSRLQLVRVDQFVELDHEPIWTNEIQQRLDQVIAEKRMMKELLNAGLNPTQTLLFTGRPGLGKTLAAKWIASKLKIPLVTLDLSAVMSSFLGRTGNNVRNVIDFAKDTECILLIDEFDAIAKRRDDVTEIGELKRLVTVLLQEIDDWTHSGILIAATNHPTLLDPAIWRRFDVVFEFPMPTHEHVIKAVRLFLEQDIQNAGNWLEILPFAFHGFSFSDIEREVNRFRRESIINGMPLEEVFKDWIREQSRLLPMKERRRLALEILKLGTYSQRQVHEWTGVSRDTIRKATQNE